MTTIDYSKPVIVPALPVVAFSDIAKPANDVSRISKALDVRRISNF